MTQRIIKDVPFSSRRPSYQTRQYLLAITMVLAVALVHIAAVYFFASSRLLTNNVTLNKYVDLSFIIYSILLIGFILLYPLFVMLFVRPRRLISYLSKGYTWHLFSRERLLFSFPALLIIPLDKSVYSSFKAEIPNIVPFWLDEPLAQLDRSIFAGLEPWRILHPLLGNPEITMFIDFLYHPLWLVMLLLVMLWHALGHHPLTHRVRFFVSYIVIWAILGNALALLLSSAGPCYFAEVTGSPDPYRDLMAYLAAIENDGDSLNAIRIQDILWSGYSANALAYGGGISAMPSLHIATLTLFTLSFHGVNPKFAWIFAVYTFLIWIGSIHLGWHYAADGLVSVPLAILVWVGVGRLVDRVFSRRPPAHALSAVGA